MSYSNITHRQVCPPIGVNEFRYQGVQGASLRLTATVVLASSLPTSRQQTKPQLELGGFCLSRNSSLRFPFPLIATSRVVRPLTSIQSNNYHHPPSSLYSGICATVGSSVNVRDPLPHLVALVGGPHLGPGICTWHVTTSSSTILVAHPLLQQTKLSAPPQTYPHSLIAVKCSSSAKRRLSASSIVDTASSRFLART